jgi:hypothetical protein
MTDERHSSLQVDTDERPSDASPGLWGFPPGKKAQTNYTNDRAKRSIGVLRTISREANNLLPLCIFLLLPFISYRLLGSVMAICLRLSFFPGRDPQSPRPLMLDPSSPLHV